ncbi:hypothetical protein MGG_17874 [Pyricularia oryzae 70-15]|uniref:Uncharacterized protein n=3 Tax=Pyricularia oryzae TaxID=318829 RepID=G5EI77_PYRO7|nr:uncharacterized protein MGG_17874 [Pyricularia oryzae 70-15]EAQ71453.1 hypothetical protein MGCH7_ch7g860 [Pyricularia oryzae 70-15]EHA45873.1 hypothetical protein MGG_17874 [Pyricularia oryzae 70-15]ELQ41028.1 hypothetical protein OOU_Y34scaffold00308g39 [Pyricularia oryzae Y34]
MAIRVLCRPGQDSRTYHEVFLQISKTSRCRYATPGSAQLALSAESDRVWVGLLRRTLSIAWVTMTTAFTVHAYWDKEPN